MRPVIVTSYCEARSVIRAGVSSSAATVEMPKVTKKTLKDEQGLRPVPTAMETDADDAPSTSGAKIKFAPMSVFDQNGKKIDFRRVRLSTV